jgi:Zn-dependent peptidase ImmA (M78 family)
MNKILQEKYTKLLSEKTLETTKRNQVLSVFLTYVCDKLSITTPPKVYLNNSIDFGSKNKTFGQFNVQDNKIVVAASNRNLADILRTVAHELVHYKQKVDGKLNLDNSVDSGATGSNIENEANAQAGVIMREFGKKHPEIYE